jgi:hypothetical protein
MTVGALRTGILHRTVIAGRVCSAAAALVVCLAVFAGRGGVAAHAQDSQTPELERRGEAHGPARGVISKATLSPPLQTKLRALRFSPDGKHILLQDESSIYILSRNPLAIELTAPARIALPARFTADSASVVVASLDMRVQRWSIADRKIVDQKTLGTGSDCEFAAVSPLGSYYACSGSHDDFRVFDVASGNEIYTANLGDNPMFLNGPSFFRFHANLPRSEPFGFLLGMHNPPPLEWVAEANLIRFSPDEHYVLTFGLFRGALAVDLKARQKVILTGELRRDIVVREAEFVAPGRVMAISHSKPGDSVLLSFPEGKVLDNLGISGVASPTSDPDFIVHFTPGVKTADLFELSKHKLIAHVSKGGTDFFGGEIASFSVGEGLVLVRAVVGQKPMLATIAAGPLPRLHAALASPGLGTLIVSANGQGAAYRVADGTQIASFPGLTGAWFDDDAQATVRVPEEEPLHSDLDSFRTEDGVTAVLWQRVDHFFEDESLVSGPVLLAEQKPIPDMLSGQPIVGAQLYGMDLKTGRPLWSRDPGGERPLPFTDPQGERVVIGWDAKTGHARNLAKRSAVVRQNMKSKKATDHDTLFEILNARTGVTEGVAYVPGGIGPQGYTSAYSAGNWLIVVKDEMRITAVSLAEGDERLRLTGTVSALSSEAGLLAVYQDGGRVNLYDLVAGARKQSFSLPENVVYMRFSADGRRLLVLTEYQTVYVLDLTVKPATEDSSSP